MLPSVENREPGESVVHCPWSVATGKGQPANLRHTIRRSLGIDFKGGSGTDAAADYTPAQGRHQEFNRAALSAWRQELFQIVPTNR